MRREGERERERETNISQFAIPCFESFDCGPALLFFFRGGGVGVMVQGPLLAACHYLSILGRSLFYSVMGPKPYSIYEGPYITMEARYVEAGSMTIFWTQNRALKTTSLARVPIRT